ncbi:MAG: Excreted virulence factor EspC, type diderm [Mycobacterium sp.]|nr:Excreted virulence factor EspC, type diderm [Mycobacterium sp.]MDT5217850.1 Excreted virulence factor EspC, type diderm [Mycobacterium sp.]
MTFDPFHVDLDGVLELSRLHADAATAMNEATGSALANATGADAAHGSIGTRVTGAFAEVLDARHGALQAAANTSGELSDRLGKAVQAYARGDESGAESVRAAAEAMDGGAAHGASGTPVASGSSGTPIDADAPSPSGAVGAAESTCVGDALGQQGAGQSLHVSESSGVGAYAAGSDNLATEPPIVAPAAHEQAERLTGD